MISLEQLRDFRITYFKLITKKKKKVVKSKAVRKKIYKKKIYMLKMVISGKQAKKYKVKAVDIGLPYAGKKIKKKTKFRIMRLYAKKIKKVKGRKEKRKKTMLGDTGANALGALAGTAHSLSFLTSFPIEES